MKGGAVMDKTFITSKNIITPNGIFAGSIMIADGKIASVDTQCWANNENDQIIDVGNLYVSPGFIDIHTHGGGGYDFMDGTVEAIEKASKEHLKHGTTSIVPTTAPCPDDELYKLFKSFEKAKREIKCGPNLIGLHLEGPYLAPAQMGAADPKYLKEPTIEHFNEILNKSDDIVRVTAAPELTNGIALGDELKRRGILASIGHSDAEYKDVCKAFEHGYTHVTHLYSAMSTVHRIGPYRHLGVIESAYLIDGMTIEIIADGRHLPPELLRLIIKCKPIEDICLVTDSMRGVGLKEGDRLLVGSIENGREVVIKDGVAMMPDFKAFSGSICTTERCIRTMVKDAGVSVIDAVRMMSTNPARIMGLGDKKGKIAVGMDADICIFDDDINIYAVFVGGKLLVNNLGNKQLQNKIC
jgi:N-acetylglucosamine-6-phosphate deacetylase